MRRLFFLLSLAAFALAGCGGGDDSGSQGGNNTGGSGGGGGNQAPVVRAGDRLVWDQRADTVTVLRTYTYSLYVDGVRGAMSAVNCGSTAAAAGYECSGGLPSMTAGLHSLEMTTVTSAGAESPRSPAFSVMVATGVSTGATSSVDDAGRPLEIICIGESKTECYEPALVATGLNGVTSIVPTTGEQMLFIEGERAVRVIEGNQVVDRPALALSQDGRLIALAVPVDFEQSRYVYVAASAPSRAGDEELSITRYRELQGSLAEGATIVTGLPLPSGAAVQMTMDAKGLLYLSMPYKDSRSSADSNTAILRFQSDGTVPSANPQFSPVIAYGYAHPSALVWDGAGNRLWLAGEDPRWPTSVSMLQTDASSRTPWPWSPVGVALQGSPSDTTAAPRLTMTSDRTGRSRSIWVVPSPGMVYRGVAQSDDRQLPLTRVTFGAIADVAMVVGGPDASLVLISESAQPSGRSSRIWRLDRIVPKVIRLS